MRCFLFMKNIKCYIKEDSVVARIAAWKLGTEKAAIVLGRTIHLHNTSKQEFLTNQSWVRHEMAHIKQYENHGYFSFVVQYLVESIRKGYNQNKFELEARKAESDETVREGIAIVQ